MDRYEFLSQEERDEILVGYFLAQERDLFCHRTNLERFDAMLKKLEPGPWRDRITQLREETLQRIKEVESLIEATRPQLPPPERLERIKQTLLAKKRG